MDCELGQDPLLGSTTARMPAASSTPDALGVAVRPVVRRLGRDRRASCCQATSWPSGAQSVGTAEEEAEGDEPLPCARREVELQLERRSRVDAETREVPALHGHAVVAELPRPAQPVEADEVVAVADEEPLVVDGLDANGLREELQLGERGVGGPVGPDDAVGAEVGVVRLLAEVAAVGPVVPACSSRTPDPVVEPLPDESALERVMALEGREVVREPAVRVAHRMRVLAEDHRPEIVGALGPGHDRVELGVHRAHDVGRAMPARPVVLDRTLVVEGPRRVAASDPAGGRVVIRPVAALVPERPADHAGMVLVALDHVARALEEGARIALVLAELVVVGVRLDVRLVDDVQPVAVAEVEPVAGRSGSARCARR